MTKNNRIRFSERKYIKNQSNAIADERLAFLDGQRLGDLSMGIEDNATKRKVRRIMEKKIAQKYYKNAFEGILAGNRARYDTRHMLTNQMKNIFGFVPEGYRFAA